MATPTTVASSGPQLPEPQSAPSSGGPKSSPSQRKNGKNWHTARSPFRTTTSHTSTAYAKRALVREQSAAVKTHERELKDEKAAVKAAQVAAIKDRRARKAERERFEKMEEKMHRKRVDRVRRREKRNKLLGK